MPLLGSSSLRRSSADPRFDVEKYHGSKTLFSRSWGVVESWHGKITTSRRSGRALSRPEPRLKTCRQHLTDHEGCGSDADIEPLLDPLSETAAEVDIPAAARCPGCARPMILQGERRQRSWWEVMISPSRPAWYRQLYRNSQLLQTARSSIYNRSVLPGTPATKFDARTMRPSTAAWLAIRSANLGVE